jgi:hypothetical protein
MRSNTGWRASVSALGVALLVAVVGSTSHDALAEPERYEFRPLVFLGDPTPGGDRYLEVFESNFINHRGDVLFSSHVVGGENVEDGLFLLRSGDVTQIARAGEPIPGGGTLGPGSLSPTTLNDEGDAGFVYLLEPFCAPGDPGCPPLGVNAGVFRFSRETHSVTPIVIPEMTEVPGGGVFKGAHFGANLNNRGELVFAGIIETENGIHLPTEPYVGLGVGIFKARNGRISSVVSPGDPAPGGGVFDGAFAPWTNDRGDVAFMGHVAGEECSFPGSPSLPGSPPQAVFIGCLGSVYVKHGRTGEIRSIAHAGDDAPGGGVYRQVISPVLNDRGDIAFLGDLTPPPLARQVTGVYLHSEGETVPAARPGDPMPGGGHFVTASNITGWQIHVNNEPEVVFNATLDTDDDGDGFPDTGLFVWSRGSLRLVARTGTVIPEVGTIRHLVMNVLVILPPPTFVPNSGANNNDRGQVVFGATLSDGGGVLLRASPTSRH